MALNHSLKFFTVFFVLMLAACCCPPNTQPADLIFYNGDVITMETDNPKAQAIAILGDEIMATGSDHDMLCKAGPNTIKINLGGKTLVPGFIDSHAHWILDDNEKGFNSIDEAMQYVVKNGWTSVNELFVRQEDLEVLQTLDNEGRIKVRVNAYMPVNYRDNYIGREYLLHDPLENFSSHVRIAGVKFVTDSYYGKDIYFTQQAFDAEIRAADDQGWQVAIHSESIEALNMVLKSLGRVHNGWFNAHRHRIEHLLMMNDTQLAEIRQKGYIASIQLNLPGNFPEQDPDFYDHLDAVGFTDFDLIGRWKDLNDAGILIAGGSDWPWITNTTFIEQGGAPAGSPLRLIYKAATHTNTADQTEAWMDGQYLTVAESMKALTINGAYATFEEDKKGSLAAGKWADVVILSDNPIAVGKADIKAVRDIDVLMTMIGGKVEYCAAGAVDLCPQPVITPTPRSP